MSCHSTQMPPQPIWNTYPGTHRHWDRQLLPGWTQTCHEDSLVRHIPVDSVISLWWSEALSHWWSESQNIRQSIRIKLNLIIKLMFYGWFGFVLFCYLVGHDLGPNCLQRLSADDTSRQKFSWTPCKQVKLLQRLLIGINEFWQV